MVSVNITLTLPDDLARKAQERGLLTSEALYRLLDNEIERQFQIDRLFETMDQFATLDIPPLTSQ